TLPKDGGPDWDCLGMTFSNDGKELAAVFQSSGYPRILCWDMSNGKLVADHRLKDDTLKRAANDPGRAVEWFPDREAWLVFGQSIIDRQTGQRIWMLPATGPGVAPTPRRVADVDRVLIVSGQGRSQLVRSIRLPKDRIAAVRSIVR